MASDPADFYRRPTSGDPAPGSSDPAAIGARGPSRGLGAHSPRLVAREPAVPDDAFADGCARPGVVHVLAVDLALRVPGAAYPAPPPVVEASRFVIPSG